MSKGSELLSCRCSRASENDEKVVGNKSENLSQFVGISEEMMYGSVRAREVHGWYGHLSTNQMNSSLVHCEPTLPPGVLLLRQCQKWVGALGSTSLSRSGSFSPLGARRPITSTFHITYFTRPLPDLDVS